ncbi:hypothetical protein JAAARDRAFT_189688 [Jaapia argillacea MUCL 33604]|uniref:Uncharacterized protein n=1 Tax=Jaapia argillacea MUCL 33604 TaxID=933084 RepID=A0A067Q5T8_9AGAM|nr:hypothetical protein JAAARDRAFT_189688 [Jaapia argillacea MUCL 33604]
MLKDSLPHATTRGTKSRGTRPPTKGRPTSHLGVVPYGVTAIMVLSILFSLLFIACISLAFVSPKDDDLAFKIALDEVVAKNASGIVLVGDDVDVDVDEPSVSISWSIIGCGSGYVLAGTEGIYGCDGCGLSAVALQIFVDGNDSPVVNYDPAQLPSRRDNGHRSSIQSLYQFSSDHVLDVHESRLYPFDTYRLATTFKAVATGSDDLPPIQRLLTIGMTSNFGVMSNDSDSFIALSDGLQQPSRDIQLYIRRPSDQRMYTMALFHVGWMLTHVTVGLAVLSWVSSRRSGWKQPASVLAILVIIPHLRNAMPDAPGFDGVLLDCIGFFPQMIISGISCIIILLLFIKHEYTQGSAERNTPDDEAPPLKVKARRPSAALSISWRSSPNITIPPPNPTSSYYCVDAASPSPLSEMWGPPAASGRPLSTLCRIRDELAKLARREEGVVQKPLILPSLHRRTYSRLRSGAI